MNRPVCASQRFPVAWLAVVLVGLGGCGAGMEHAAGTASGGTAGEAPGGAAGEAPGGAARTPRGPEAGMGEALREDLRPRFEEAKRLLRYHRRTKARVLLRELVREQPGCAALRFHLGLAFRSRRMRAQSLQTFTDLAARFPASPLGSIGLALLAADDGLVEQARHHLAAARATGISHPWLDFVAGSSAMLAGEDDEALAAFRRASDADPLLTDAWTNQAILLERRGATREAETALRAALRAHPFDLAALNQLALLLARTGREEKAREYRAQHDRLSLVADLSLAPPGTTPQARRKLAAHYTQTGQLAQALDELTALLRDEPGDEAARTEAARLRRLLAERGK